MTQIYCTYMVTRKFIEGSLCGMTIDTITSVDMSSLIGETLGGGHLGPKYILVNCYLIT